MNTTEGVSIEDKRLLISFLREFAEQIETGEVRLEEVSSAVQAKIEQLYDPEDQSYLNLELPGFTLDLHVEFVSVSIEAKIVAFLKQGAKK